MVSRIYTEILIYYLKNNKSALWKELSETSGPILYGSKTFIRFRYIFGTEDDDDRRILRLKIKIRNFLKIGLFLFIGVPLLFAFLFFICVLSGQR